MKFARLSRLFILALFVLGIACFAQDQTPAPRPADNPMPSTTMRATVNSPATAEVTATSTQATPQSPIAPVRGAADQVPASQAAPPAAVGAPSNTYVIGPSDVLNITVWKEPTLSSSLLVRPDGMISLPLLGDVLATGLTPLQLADQIASKLKKFVQDPNVSVVVSQIHSKIVYLLGEVGKKGPIEMTPGMTVLEAIGSAGGLTDYANAKKIYILRNEGGRNEKIPVKYKQALKGDRSLDLVLKSGDTIVVP
jgi:polysaccharide export outer membrane protein